MNDWTVSGESEDQPWEYRATAIGSVMEDALRKSGHGDLVITISHAKPMVLTWVYWTARLTMSFPPPHAWDQTPTLRAVLAHENRPALEAAFAMGGDEGVRKLIREIITEAYNARKRRAL